MRISFYLRHASFSAGIFHVFEKRLLEAQA